MPSPIDARTNLPNHTLSSLATRYYQLTHDYLVPSLREWLTRKQREMRRGRAELKLAERAAGWHAIRENKQLPTLWEWLSIRTLTDQRNWSTPQTEMMRAAGRIHGLWAGGVSLLLMVGLISGIVIRNSVLAERDRIQSASVEQQNEANAKGLVETLVKADSVQVPDIVKQLGDYRKWADPLLEVRLSSAADDSAEKIHLSLALVDQDERQVDYLYRQLLRTESQRFPVIRDALEKHQERLRDRLYTQGHQ